MEKAREIRLYMFFLKKFKIRAYVWLADVIAYRVQGELFLNRIY
jgi:hypothetical protein